MEIFNGLIFLILVSTKRIINRKAAVIIKRINTIIALEIFSIKCNLFYLLSLFSV